MQLPEVGLHRGSFPGCLWHSLDINSQSCLQAAALFSECGLEQPRQDRVWLHSLQAQRMSCPGSPRCERFARCWPQLCTGQCSFKADRVPWRGEEGDKRGNERFLQHLLIAITHSIQPSWEPAMLQLFLLHSNQKLLYFSDPGQMKNKVFASCKYNYFPKPEARTFLPLQNVFWP